MTAIINSKLIYDLCGSIHGEDKIVKNLILIPKGSLCHLLLRKCIKMYKNHHFTKKNMINTE